jgi:hypothetical protein
MMRVERTLDSSAVMGNPSSFSGMTFDQVIANIFGVRLASCNRRSVRRAWFLVRTRHSGHTGFSLPNSLIEETMNQNVFRDVNGREKI